LGVLYPSLFPRLNDTWIDMVYTIFSIAFNLFFA